ncbi:MAG: hypothetical protein MN733_03395 [Nitrososphaera sp.]|nr:hypothetical protein [Nitrososphaera sp.]
MSNSPNDYPFQEVVDHASKLIADGHTVFQKFTCSGCGARQTIDVPNTFYTSGSCEECHHITDLTKNGCNFMLLAGTRQPSLSEIRRAQNKSAMEVKKREENRS